MQSGSGLPEHRFGVEDDLLPRKAAHGLEGFAQVPGLDVVLDATLVRGKGGAGGTSVPIATAARSAHRNRDPIPTIFCPFEIPDNLAGFSGASQQNCNLRGRT
jgi:hypothetical protein